MDEFGFRGSSSDSLSVSYTPVIPSAASRRTATSRSNVSLYLSQPSRLPSPRGSNPASKPSGIHAKESSLSGPVSSSGNTGLARFRSLRSMLPFGPKQSNNNSTVTAPSSAPLPREPTNPSVTPMPTQTFDLRHRRSSSSIPAPAPMANTSKGFLSVGRRTSLSLQKEKSLPAIPSLPRSHSEDIGAHPSPVMGISRRSTSPNKSDAGNRGLPLPDDPFKKPSPNDVTTNFFQRGPSREEFGTIRSRDLSTIIESELSHLSILKHSPSLSPSQGDDSKARGDNESDNQILAQLHEQEVRNNNLSIMHGQDMDVNAATADLSASWEAGVAELRQSLHLRVPGDRRSGDGRVSPSTYSVSPVSAPSSAQELTPPNSLPATSKSEVQLNSPVLEQDGGVIIDLSRVDTDFAALLDLSKRPTCVDDDIVVAVNSMEPPPSMDSSPSASPSPEPESDRRSIVDPNDKMVSDTTSRRTSAQSRERLVGMQSSPVRRSRPPSLVLSIDSLPLADHATRLSADRTPVNNKVQQSRLSPAPRPDPVSPRTSLEDLTETVRRPGTVGRAFQSKSATSEEPVKRRARVARLYETPSRPSTAGSVSVGRTCSEGGYPFLADSQETEDRVASVYSPITHSRPTTSLGMASRARNALNGEHPERPATALSSIGRGTPPISQRNRKRSLSASVDARPQGRTVPDWMGPRTARAFAAAGLLDTDTDQTKERNVPPVPPRAESRMRLTGSRPSLDRESVGTCSTPSLYAPSRAGFSERSIPPSSAGRRRTSSRTMTIAEITSARGESPVTSITSSSHARTIFSSSTATSLSCSSPHQHYQVAHLESELSSLREKHSTEMEAVLSALADSQRTSKALREENSQLQGRIRDLEEQLADMGEQLDEARRQPPPPPPSMPSSLTRSLLRQHRLPQQSGDTRAGLSSHESPRGSPSRNRAFVRSSVDSLGSDFDVGETHTTIREHEGLLTPNFLPSSLLQSRENRPRTRASTASSIFPVLPSNMSMLLHDEGSDTSSIPLGGFGLLQSNTYASSAGSPVASPTLNVNRMATASSIAIEKTNERSRHATTLSLSSIEMSMLSSLPGSPESLKLKPEHEKHLCDLKSLDFSVIDSD